MYGSTSYARPRVTNSALWALVDRIRAFLSRHPWISDGLFWALPLTWVGVAYIVGQTGPDHLVPTISWLSVGATSLMTGPLVLRRLAPLPSSLLIAVGCVLSLFTEMWPSFSLIAFPLTVFSTAKWGTRSQSRIVLILGFAGALVMGLSIFTLALQGTVGIGARPLDNSVYFAVAIYVVMCAAIVLSSWLLGILAHRRQQAVEDIRERNHLLERERESESLLAADAERMRIAREMHDIIAHSLSVVIAQADGGRYVAKSDPDAAAQALTTIAQTGRDALAQTRNLLSVLRTNDFTGQDKSPLPGLADIPSLITDVRSAGLAISFESTAFTASESTTVDSLATRLPAGAGLAVYRIIQEALTNVLKHAPSGARARVTLKGADRDFIVRIVDDGGPVISATASSGSSGSNSMPPDDGAHEHKKIGDGSGILGMRERAALYGGTVDAGPSRTTDAGFVVTARFPLAPETLSAPLPTPASDGTRTMTSSLLSEETGI